jgi:uncharacterized membrane protein YfcA
MEILVLLITGGIIGFLSAFFGIGGGALIVPVLYSLYPTFTDEHVISTSLLTIFFLTLNNSILFYKKGLFPPKKVIINFIFSAGIGAFLGSKLTFLIDTDTSKKIIASVLILIVTKLFFFEKKQNDQENKPTNMPKLFITGFSGAFISSISGLGGGVIFIPLLVSFAKTPLKLVSPYSNLAMLIATLMGSLPHLLATSPDMAVIGPLFSKSFLGNANLSMVVILSLSGYYTSRFGIKYNDLIKPSTKKFTLASLLLTLSLKLFFM